VSNATRITRILARVFGVIMLVSAFGLLALCGSCCNRTAKFKKTAVEVQGTVIEMKEGISAVYGHTVYYPIIRYADTGGQEHTLYSNAGSYPPRYAVGDRISVLYDPARPNAAQVNIFTHLWLMPIILGIIGGPDLLIGLFVFFAVPHMLARAEKRAAEASSQ